jgi:predicted lipase
MNYLSRLEEGLTESLGPWTYLHSLGAAVVLVVAVAIAVNIWPGWQQVGAWLW